MRTTSFVIAVGVLIGFGMSPTASAQGGDETGACLILGALPGQGLGIGDGKGGPFDLCIDGTSEIECADFCGKTGDSPEPGGPIGDCAWLSGKICGDLGTPWDGACDVDGLFCVLIGGPTPADSEALCDEGGKGGTTWYPGATTCGGAPVPALPKAAYAALALVLLAGSLALLTVYGGRT